MPDVNSCGIKSPAATAAGLVVRKTDGRAGRRQPCPGAPAHRCNAVRVGEFRREARPRPPLRRGRVAQASALRDRGHPTGIAIPKNDVKFPREASPEGNAPRSWSVPRGATPPAN
jgi:hypothetical protein